MPFAALTTTALPFCPSLLFFFSWHSHLPENISSLMFYCLLKNIIAYVLLFIERLPLVNSAGTWLPLIHCPFPTLGRAPGTWRVLKK